MPPPFTSRHAGAGSGGKRCLVFGACLPLLLGVNTGFALHGRVVLSTGVDTEGGVCVCAPLTQAASTSTKTAKKTRNLLSPGSRWWSDLMGYSILPASRAMCRLQFSIRQHARAAHWVRRRAVLTAVSLASRNNLIVN